MEGGVGGIYVALLMAGGELIVGWPKLLDAGSKWPVCSPVEFFASWMFVSKVLFCENMFNLLMQ